MTGALALLCDCLMRLCLGLLFAVGALVAAMIVNSRKPRREET